MLTHESESNRDLDSAVSSLSEIWDAAPAKNALLCFQPKTSQLSRCNNSEFTQRRLQLLLGLVRLYALLRKSRRLCSQSFWSSRFASSSKYFRCGCTEHI